MHDVHASFDPDAVRASCDNYDPTSYLSLLVHHCIISACIKYTKSANRKKKIGQIRSNFSFSMQKNTTA